ncbi:GntR family transcriptional regulator [Marinilactibacillus kalidii]|uniref:GntR family transcriptional regulator n=1 Tax=Marinilactibacillus kalidii TaxID=2820274 RepID=UPI001ABEDECB|nr:GntR family transcriptional regulator [Marinilactibacillus kalidii]
MSKSKKREIEAYEYIKEKIESKEWLPQKHLREQDVAIELNMSRTPIRNAFLRLAQEKVIVIEPYKGAKVLPVQIDFKAYQDRLGFIELIITHYLMKLEKEEVQLVLVTSSERLNDMEQSSQMTNQLFETQEWQFWQSILTLEKNQYQYALVVNCFKELLTQEGKLQSILYKSRQTKLKHYRIFLEFLTKKNYPYARREMRIMLNQIRLNIIQNQE